MTDFYQNKKNAIKILDDMLKKECTVEHIEYVISRSYGFSKVWIMQQIKLYKDLKEQQRGQGGGK